MLLLGCDSHSCVLFKACVLELSDESMEKDFEKMREVAAYLTVKDTNQKRKFPDSTSEARKSEIRKMARGYVLKGKNIVFCEGLLSWKSLELKYNPQRKLNQIVNSLLTGFIQAVQPEFRASRFPTILPVLSKITLFQKSDTTSLKITVFKNIVRSFFESAKYPAG